MDRLTVREVRLRGASESERTPVDPLRLGAPSEADVGEADTRPRDHSTHGRHGRD